MRRVRRRMAYLATFLGAGSIFILFAAAPPVAEFVLAVCAACGWCLWLERSTIPQGSRTRMHAAPHRRPLLYLTDGRGLAMAVVTLALTTLLYTVALGVSDPTIVALTLLLVVVVVAAISSWRVAVTTSLLAFLLFNFFFLPPVGTFVIHDARHWVALFTLLAVSLVASYLATEVRGRANEAARAEIARRSAELKSSLLASLGHDLKTPLTALTVAADNLAASWLTEEERRDQLEVLQVELVRLNRLFGNLIDMARIEARSVTADPEWVLTTEIVDAARQQVEASLEGHPVEVQDASEGLFVRVDPRLTSAALAHVIENAAQHSPAGAPISLSIDASADEVRFTVRDRGAGIDFDGMALSARPNKEGFTRGTGLGLSITRGLLSAQGGHIWGEKDPAGGGAVFTLAIPAASRPATALEQE